MKINMKKILNILYIALVVFLILIALVVASASLNFKKGFQFYSIQSGSMAPSIHVGDAVVVKPAEDYQVGDVVTFSDIKDSKTKITHRIYAVEVENGSLRYVTKGDANDIEDLPRVLPSRILGKVLFRIPLFGYLLAFARTQTGFILLIVMPATILIYGEIMNIKKEFGKMLSNRKLKDENEEESNS